MSGERFPPKQNTGRTCGACGMCCKVYKMPEMKKDAGQWCRHYCSGKGCEIYVARPYSGAFG